MIGISSDGDHRLLASMLYQIKHPCDYKFVQDPTHIGTKLRNRLLKSSIVLPLGNKQISLAHLKMLINSAPKLIHGLTIGDINPKDRQNYASYEKITSERVRNALSNHVVGSDGTIKYLEKCHQITSSYMQYDLMPLERVYRIFNAVFFLRIWSSWIKSSCAYKVNENFITSNCYKSIEINAMNLVSLIKQFRNENSHERFLPTLFDSQSCEKIFRHFRSMGTANYTKINFTMFELLNMVRRAEIRNEIDQYKLSDVDIVFPRTNHIIKTKVTSLPTDDEIEQITVLAKKHAIEEAEKFQLTATANDIDEFQFLTPKFSFDRDDIETEEENILQESDDDFDLIDLCAGDEISSDLLNELAMADESADENENCPYTLISNEKGVKSRVRKSALVWALSTSSQKLSNDRLNRVKSSAPKACVDMGTFLHSAHHNKRQTTHPKNEIGPKSYVQKLDIINIGDWCFFQNEKTEQILIGVILRFQYAYRKTDKEKFYAGDTVSLSYQSDINTIEALSTLYHLSQDGDLNGFPNNHINLNLSNYIATLVEIIPTFENDQIFFNSTDLVIVKENLKRIQ